MTQQELAEIGYRLILGNTYHLHLRPGEALIQRAIEQLKQKRRELEGALEKIEASMAELKKA